MFTWGLSGSGKDTICNALKKRGVLTLRIARTIKQVICEKYDITMEELDHLKRFNPAFRELHRDVQVYLETLDKSVSGEDVVAEGPMNRLKQLVNYTAFDYDMLPASTLMSFPRVIVDVRKIDEVRMLLKSGFHGIFLTRIPTEHVIQGHPTEVYLPLHEVMMEFESQYPYQIHLIDNRVTSEPIPFTCMPEITCIDSSANKLINAAFNVINNIK